MHFIQSCNGLFSDVDDREAYENGLRGARDQYIPVNNIEIDLILTKMLQGCRYREIIASHFMTASAKNHAIEKVYMPMMADMTEYAIKHSKEISPLETLMPGRFQFDSESEESQTGTPYEKMEAEDVLIHFSEVMQAVTDLLNTNYHKSNFMKKKMIDAKVWRIIKEKINDADVREGFRSFADAYKSEFKIVFEASEKHSLLCKDLPRQELAEINVLLQGVYKAVAEDRLSKLFITNREALESLTQGGGQLQEFGLFSRLIKVYELSLADRLEACFSDYDDPAMRHVAN